MGKLYCHVTDDTSVSVQGATRSKPRNFGDFLRYPLSAYIQYAFIDRIVPLYTNAMYEEMRKFEERWRLQGIWKAISRNLSSLW